MVCPVISDDEFLAATVTGRPMLHETDFIETSTSGTAQTDNIAPRSNLNLLLLIIRAETVKSHPKVQARKMSNEDQRKRKSRVLFNILVKLIIIAEKNPKRKKKRY